MKVDRAIVMLVATSFVLILAEAADTKADNDKKCGPHAKWNDCGIVPGCVKNCGNRDIQFKCVASCNAGCYCEEGYIRKSKRGPCIRECDCPERKE